MAREFESMLTGLNNAISQYMGYSTQMAMQGRAEEAKSARELENKRTLQTEQAALDLTKGKQMAEYENQLATSRDLMKIALEEEAKGKDYTPGSVVAEMTGMPHFAKVSRVDNKTLFNYFQSLKEIEAKAKNTKQGKIPVGLLDQEAQLIATEQLFKQVNDLFFQKDEKGNLTGIKTGGLLQQGLSNVTGGALGSKEERQYEEFIDGIVGNFARVISAEKGALREEDIQRARSLFPRLREAPEVQLKKLSLIQDTLAQRKKTLYEMQEKAKKAPQTGLEDISNEELLNMFNQMRSQQK